MEEVRTLREIRDRERGIRGAVSARRESVEVARRDSMSAERLCDLIRLRSSPSVYQIDGAFHTVMCLKI